MLLHVWCEYTRCTCTCFEHTFTYAVSYGGTDGLDYTFCVITLMDCALLTFNSYKTIQCTKSQYVHKHTQIVKHLGQSTSVRPKVFLD
jgi:hypothetical protein